MKQVTTLFKTIRAQRLPALGLAFLLATGSVRAQTGNRLNFDGNDDYVSLPASLTAGVTNFTFEAWLNYQDTRNWTRVLDFGTSTTVNMFLTPRNADNNAPRFAITTGGNGGEERLTGTTELSAGWHHLAVTLSRSGNVVTGTLYVDGAVAATNPNMTLTPGSLGTLSQLYLGHSEYTIDPYIKGEMDEIRLYNIALTQAQVQADRSTNTSAVPANLLAYYDFNQGVPAGNNPTETTLLDRSSNARPGTLNNFALTGSTSNWVGNTPLPVDLVAFTAQVDGHAARVQWATASEKNSASFEVERSRDGQQFTRLATLTAQGTKSGSTTYGYRDEQAAMLAGLLYYRLRQVDQDGTAHYSPVRTVQLAVTPGLMCYPNPAEAGALTALTGAAPSRPVQVLDALGRVAATATTDAAGTATLHLPPSLTSGVYLVRTGTSALRLIVP